jgi:uncharacterized phage-associated protein
MDIKNLLTQLIAYAMVLSRIVLGRGKMISCKDVAKYFLTLNDEEVGELISNLKLQKLVYYAQGFHLAITGELLFPDSVEAWAHGPVIPILYHEYKPFLNGPIPPPDDFDPDKIDRDTKDLLDEVYKVFGQFSAWKLRNMTHEEPPWKEAWETTKIISRESMKVYFKTLVNP